MPDQATTNSMDCTNSANNDKRVLRIAVGTKNPCKIDAVTKAIKQSIRTAAHRRQSTILAGTGLPINDSDDTSYDIQIEGFAVESGVADQPMGDQETILGAKNRAIHAHHAYKKSNKIFPHLSFGLEGGLEWSQLVLDQDDEKTLWCMAWMAVYGKRNSLPVDAMASSEATSWRPDKDEIFSLAKTGSFMLPSALSDLVKEGMELGHADDKVFNRTNSKHGSGTVGYLTNDMIDRSEYYEHALILALVPWIRPDVYSSKGFPKSSDGTGTENAVQE